LLKPGPAGSSDRTGGELQPRLLLTDVFQTSVPARLEFRRLVISVTSLPRAKAFLREKGLLGTDSEEEAAIDPSKIHGLNISVVGKAR
jgi:hypothetical protein